MALWDFLGHTDFVTAVTQRRTEVTGTGLVTIDDFGATFLVPKTPALDPVLQSAHAIPLRDHVIDCDFDGEWVV